MQTSPSPRFEDPAQWQALAREQPLAVLVFETPDQPRIQQLPLQLREDAEGLWVEGHMAAAQAPGLSEDMPCQVLFHGPHAYVSPTLYDSPLNVPTWNFLQLQLRGTLHLVHAAQEKTALLARLVEQMEPSYATQWEGLPANFRGALLDAIVGLRIRVQSVRPRAKLGQNKSPAERERMAARWADSNPELVRWMQRLNLA